MVGHTLYEGGKLSAIETLEEHLNKVGNLAEEFGERFGCAQPCRVLGLYHDIGKASDIFGKRVGVIPSNGEPIHYDHMMAGALEMLRMYGHKAFGQAMAMAIACHHGGLINYSTRPSVLSEKTCLTRDETFVERAENYKASCKADKDYKVYDEVYPLADRLSEYCNEIDADQFGLKANRKSYYTGRWAMLTRVLFSCLVDADCLCTEAYYRPSATLERENKHSTLKELRTRLVNYCKTVCKNDTPINQWRTKIMDCAKRMAPSNRGLFTLEADVGGGKTLAMLMFALMHAINHGMKRIVYLAPYGAVIEQTANQLKKIFGDNNVCVHHINMDTDKLTMADLMACDNWDVPIIVSSSEQLLDSMYSNKNNRCRKLHNVADSVILFDEFHAIPLDKMWSACHAIESLLHSRIFNSSVLLASATLPVMAMFRLTLSSGEMQNLLTHKPKAIVPDNLIHSPIKRVEFKFDRSLHGWASVAKKAASFDQCMVIVNTRQTAFELAEYMKKQGIESVYHLSASMTPAHHERVFSDVKKLLAEGKTVRLVCTSIVQTGVDISFPNVLREWCGQDSLDQASGRCNRSAERDIGHCIMFPQCGGAVPGLPMKQMAAMKTVLANHHFDLEKAVKDKPAYWQQYVNLYLQDCEENREFDCSDVKSEELRDTEINFDTIAGRAKIIDDTQQELLVPLDDESRMITDKIIASSKIDTIDLDKMDASERAKYLVTRSDTRKMQRFAVRSYGNDSNENTVTFYDWLVKVKLATKVDGRKNTYILESGYDPEYGMARLYDQFKSSKPRNRRNR